MRADEFVSNEDLDEHKLIFSRSGQKLKTKYRCTSGPKAGRIVPDPSACGKPFDVKKRAQMKRTRATKKAQQARKARKTKRVNPASRVLAQLNRTMKAAGSVKQAARAVRMASKSTRKPQKPKSPQKIK